MRKFLGTLVIITMIGVGAGLYRGWFDVATEDQPGATNVELRIDKEKIKQDAEAAKEKARELADRNNDQTEDLAAEESVSGSEQE